MKGKSKYITLKQGQLRENKTMIKFNNEWFKYEDIKMLLEKTIPFKVIVEYEEFEEEGHSLKEGKCKCNFKTDNSYNFCNRCGQRLSWEW